MTAKVTWRNAIVLKILNTIEGTKQNKLQLEQKNMYQFK